MNDDIFGSVKAMLLSNAGYREICYEFERKDLVLSFAEKLGVDPANIVGGR